MTEVRVEWREEGRKLPDESKRRLENSKIIDMILKMRLFPGNQEVIEVLYHDLMRFVFRRSLLLLWGECIGGRQDYWQRGLFH